jgi:hypothetical protein
VFSDGVVTMRGQAESSRGSCAAAHGSDGTGPLRMQSSNTFIIESELSRHRLLLNGQEIGTFATLESAEEEATEFANRAVPGITLRFELDFKWVLSDLEIRTATVTPSDLR